MGVHISDQLYLVTNDPVIKLNLNNEKRQGLHILKKRAVRQVHIRQADAQTEENQRHGVPSLPANVLILGELVQQALI